jgi:hypothetical protein
MSSWIAVKRKIDHQIVRIDDPNNIQPKNDHFDIQSNVNCQLSKKPLVILRQQHLAPRHSLLG